MPNTTSQLQQQHHQPQQQPHNNIPYPVQLPQQTFPQPLHHTNALYTNHNSSHTPRQSTQHHRQRHAYHQRSTSSNYGMSHPHPQNPSVYFPPQPYYPIVNANVYSSLITSGYSPQPSYTPSPPPPPLPHIAANDDCQQQQLLQQQQQQQQQFPTYMPQHMYNPLLPQQHPTDDSHLLFMSNIQDILKQNHQLQLRLQDVNTELFRVSEELRQEKQGRHTVVVQDDLKLREQQQTDTSQLHEQLARLTDAYKLELVQKDKMIEEQAETIATQQQRLVALQAEKDNDRNLFESALEAHAAAVDHETRASKNQMICMHNQEMGRMEGKDKNYSR